MNEIGQLLKSSRENQGLSLEQIANKTKIHIHKLQAIEEGHIDRLPAKVFAIGLIKSYARELKVDLQVINDLCSSTFGVQNENIDPVSIPSNEQPAETKPVGRFQIPKAAAVGASILISLVLLVIIFVVVEKMNSYSKEEVIASNSEASSALQDNNISTVDDVIDEASNEEESLQAKPEVNKPIKSLPKKIDSDLIKTDTVLNKKNDKINLVKATSPKPPILDQIKTIDKVESKRAEPIAPRETKVDNKIIITASAPVRLEIIWSDGYVQVMLLKTNERKILVFSTPITLKINNGGAVKISSNDKAAKIPGPQNQPIELKYP